MTFLKELNKIINNISAPHQGAYLNIQSHTP